MKPPPFVVHPSGRFLARSDGKPFVWEQWNSRDGQTWFRGEKSGGSVVKLPSPNPFALGSKVSSLVRAPRSLNEPLRCSVSSFK